MRLLVIEDELRIATAIKRSLSAEHFAVDIVSDSDTGLSHALSPDYDLIILDRMLPGSMNGLDICTRVRSEGITTPILMLTAISDLDSRISGLQEGADDYMVKPFSMKELIMRVKVLLRRPKTIEGQSTRIADLEVSIETFEAKRNNQRLDLSPREFKLLAYLAKNKDKTVSKQNIITHAWDDDADIMPNTVEVYIASLRKKIDKAYPGKPVLLHTAHGFGYRLGEK